MKQRLQKLIAASGVVSRRKAEDMISAGRVEVNGCTADIGSSADPDVDVITIDGKPLPLKEEPVYIMLNKPQGYLSTVSDDRGRRTVAELVKECPGRVFPVGRLDLDSEGLLLFTNDGDAAFRLMHPSHMIEKEYMVWVSGSTDGVMGILNGPMTIEDYVINPAKAVVHSREGALTVLSVTITEGRKRQVRHMCSAVGLTVRKLVRVREGILHLGELPSGKWRYLDEKEINYIKGQ